MPNEKSNHTKSQLAKGNFKNILKGFFRIGFFALLIVAFVSVESTSSFFFDTATISTLLETATLDMHIRSGQTSLSPINKANVLKPGEAVSRDIYLEKDGSLPLRYGATVQKNSTCDEELFEKLDLQVYYNFYHTQNPEDSASYNKHRTMTSLYKGKLADFNLNNSIPNDEKLQIPNSNNYFENKFYTENEHWLYFQVSLPAEVATSLQRKSCDFDFDFNAWQTNNNNGELGFSASESISNTVSTGTWVLPKAPTPLGWNTRSTSEEPSNLPVAIACGGITNGDFDTKGDGKVAFLWDEVEYADFEVSYEKQWLRPGKDSNVERNWEGSEIWKENFTNFRKFGSDAGKEGVWHNRIRTIVDTTGDGTAKLESDWSSPCEITYDRTAPLVEINSPTENEAEEISGTISIKGSVEDANPHHYWLVIQDSKGRTIAGPGTINRKSSFTNKELATWDTTAFADGVYTIKLEARDAANNKDTTSSHWINVKVNNSTATADSTTNETESTPIAPIIPTKTEETTPAKATETEEKFPEEPEEGEAVEEPTDDTKEELPKKVREEKQTEPEKAEVEEKKDSQAEKKLEINQQAKEEEVEKILQGEKEKEKRKEEETAKKLKEAAILREEELLKQEQVEEEA